MLINSETGRSSIARLAAAAQEPDWYTQVRNQALSTAVQAPFPEWDRTDAELFPLHLEPIPVSGKFQEGEPSPAFSTLSQGTDSPVQVYLQPEAAAYGVVFSDLLSAMRTHGDLVRKHLGSVIPPDENKFTALHYAYLNTGTFIYVPRNVELAIPFRITRSSIDLERILSVHTLIVAESGARVSVIEDHEREGTGPVFLTHLVEVVTGEGAAVHFTQLQNLGTGCSHFALRRAVLARDAQVEWLLASLGAQKSKDTTETVLKGDGSQGNSLMLFFATARQHCDLSVNMTHEGQHTSSDVLARGVVGDKARGIYRALTHIARGARYTSAYQKENALLLSKEARADAIPALTIDEDEVQAGHAATVGQVDEDQLFYLMSRGLTRAEAVKIVVSGFFDPVLQRLPESGVREQLQQFIDRKMPR